MSESGAVGYVNRIKLGHAIWMIAAMSLAAMATAFAKALTDELHVVQILWIRLVLGSVLLWPLFRWTTGKALPGFGSMHLLRAVILVGMTGLWFLALSLGPVTQAAAVSYTYPIFILVFAALFFGQRIQKIDVGSILLCLAGVAIIFGLGWSGGPLSGQDIVQISVVLCSSVLIAIRVSVEKLMTVDNSPEDIILGSMLIATVFVLPATVPVWKNLTLDHAVLLVGLALTATLSQLFVIKLLRQEAWSAVSVFAFWEVLAAIFLGIVLFAESLSWAGASGAMLIVVGGLMQVGRGKS